MIFLIPFFFLLVESLPESLLLLSAGLAFGSVEAAESELVPEPAAGAGSLPAAGAAGLAVAPAGAALSAAGAAVSPEELFDSPAGAALVVVPVSPVSTVEPPVAPVPGVAISTTAVLPGALLPPPTPICALPPPVSTSADSAPSDSGSIFGAPVFAAVMRSWLGPEWTSAIGPLLTNPGCSRGAAASACIHASALGSGCGTGTPKATSFFLASPTSGESG